MSNPLSNSTDFIEGEELDEGLTLDSDAKQAHSYHESGHHQKILHLIAAHTLKKSSHFVVQSTLSTHAMGHHNVFCWLGGTGEVGHAGGCD